MRKFVNSTASIYMSRASLAWDSVQWPLVVARISKLQRRIYKAKLVGPTKRVHWLQNKLIHSFDAKLLAVHLVTTFDQPLQSFTSHRQSEPSKECLDLATEGCKQASLLLPTKKSNLGTARVRQKDCLQSGIARAKGCWQLQIAKSADGLQPSVARSKDCFNLALQDYKQCFQSKVANLNESLGVTSNAISYQLNLVDSTKERTGEASLYNKGDQWSPSSISSNEACAKQGIWQSAMQSQVVWQNQTNSAELNKLKNPFLFSKGQETKHRNQTGKNKSPFSVPCFLPSVPQAKERKEHLRRKSADLFSTFSCNEKLDLVQKLAIDGKSFKKRKTNTCATEEGPVEGAYKGSFQGDISILKFEKRKKWAYSLNNCSAPLSLLKKPHNVLEKRKVYKRSMILDKAKQTLIVLALEPEWEALFEPNSFGFRPGRSVHDAMETAFSALHDETNKYALSANIKKIIGKVNAFAKGKRCHNYLLSKLGTFKLLENQISAWLEAGIMSESLDSLVNSFGLAKPPKECLPPQTASFTQSFPFVNTEFADASPLFCTVSVQKRILSSLLVNILLHGIESHLTNFVASLYSDKPISFVKALLSLKGNETSRNNHSCGVATASEDSFLSPSVLRALPKAQQSTKEIFYQKSLTIVRFGDELMLFHVQRPILELCVTEIERWLVNIGLKITEKTCFIKDCRQSLTFLGFNIIQISMAISRRSNEPIPKKAKNVVFTEERVRRNNTERPTESLTIESCNLVAMHRISTKIQEGAKKDRSPYKAKITPSRQACVEYLAKIRSIIQQNRQVSTYDLICKIRPITNSWINYYRFCECSAVFQKMGNLIFQMLRHWVFRRHPREKRSSVKEKYWPSGRTYQFEQMSYKSNWVLCGKFRTKTGVLIENFLPHIFWAEKRKFVKIQGNRSPYDSNHAYWIRRKNLLAGVLEKNCNDC